VRVISKHAAAAAAAGDAQQAACEGRGHLKVLLLPLLREAYCSLQGWVSSRNMLLLLLLLLLLLQVMPNKLRDKKCMPEWEAYCGLVVCLLSQTCCCCCR
jgi:hypothetical protein